MNRTHLEHAGLAAGMMIAAALPLILLDVPGALLIALAIPVTWFLAREATQHEYKLALGRGWRWGRPLPVAWWEGIIRGWSRDSLLDWLAPTAVCLLILLGVWLSPLPI